LSHLDGDIVSARLVRQIAQKGRHHLRVEQQGRFKSTSAMWGCQEAACARQAASVSTMRAFDAAAGVERAPDGLGVDRFVFDAQDAQPGAVRSTMRFTIASSSPDPSVCGSSISNNLKTIRYRVLVIFARVRPVTARQGAGVGRVLHRAGPAFERVARKAQDQVRLGGDQVVGGDFEVAADDLGVGRVILDQQNDDRLAFHRLALAKIGHGLHT
jgi:hypothetical protein